MRMPPFLHILLQHFGTPEVKLVGHHKRIGRQGIDGCGSLASGGGAGVEISQRGIPAAEQTRHMPNHMAKNHRRCILHIIGALMHGGVVGEIGTLRQIEPGRTPGHRVGGGTCQHGRKRGVRISAPVDAHRHHGGGVFQRIHKSVGKCGEIVGYEPAVFVAYRLHVRAALFGSCRRLRFA